MGFELAPDPGDRGEPDVKLGRTGGSAVGENPRLVATGCRCSPVARSSARSARCRSRRRPSSPPARRARLRRSATTRAGARVSGRRRDRHRRQRGRAGRAGDQPRITAEACAEASVAAGSRVIGLARAGAGTLEGWPRAGPPASSGFVATCGFATTRRCARRSTAHERVVPVFCFDDRLLHGRHASGPADAVPARVPRRPRPRAARRGSAWSCATARPSASWPSSPARSGAERGPRHARTSSPFARAGARACARRSRDAAIELRRAPRAERGRRARDRDQRGQAVHGLLALSPHVARAAAPRRARARRASCRRCPRGCAKGRLPVARSRSGSSRRSTEPAPRRRGPRRAGRSSASSTGRSASTPTTTTRSAATRPRASRPTCTSAASRPAQIEERLPRGKGAGGVSPPALLARLPPPRPAPLPAQRAVGVPGPLPRQDPVELRAAAVRGLVRGPHRLSARRRRDAPAAPRGLDAQPRPARRRLVPDQGPGHRLALGRALVHAPADRRRRGQQQRQLAVDRVGRDRPAARLPPHLQPGPPPGALRPRRTLRPALRARARAASRTGTCASRGRCPRRSSASAAA